MNRFCKTCEENKCTVNLAEQFVSGVVAEEGDTVVCVNATGRTELIEGKEYIVLSSRGDGHVRVNSSKPEFGYYPCRFRLVKRKIIDKTLKKLRDRQRKGTTIRKVTINGRPFFEPLIVRPFIKDGRWDKESIEFFNVQNNCWEVCTKKSLMGKSIKRMTKIERVLYGYPEVK